MKFKIRHSVIICISFFCYAPNIFSQWNPNYSIGTKTGNYVFTYNQTPDNLVEIFPPLITTGATLFYQWEKSNAPVTGFVAIAGATQSSYTFSAPQTQTTYYRRKVTDSYGSSVYSNIIKIQAASNDWENINYVREHDILRTGMIDSREIENIPIGDRLQTTTYLDGLGRPLEKISRETSTPAEKEDTWGDIVQFNLYDAYGRQPLQYLPYTTNNTVSDPRESGKYKADPLKEQPEYYKRIYDEAYAYTNITYDNSPLNRVMNVKSPGASWANSHGNSADYDLNDERDDVQIFTIGYNETDVPVSLGRYQANTLYKTIHIDENGKKVIEYTNTLGQLILKKVQIDNEADPTEYRGFICTYNVYDDFGLLRFVMQPEAVKYLAAKDWSFEGNGEKVLNEMCFQYLYDDKGRCMYKKAPGAAPLRMLYDSRDRVVFMQDGNQAAKSPAEWTVNLYDELDRTVITALYHTTESLQDLQSDIAHANGVITPIQITAEGQNVNVTLYGNPVSRDFLNSPDITTIAKYQFYDDYSFAGAKPFDANFANTDTYSNSELNVIPIATSKRTISFPTGSMTRILSTDIFLKSTEYYDEKGRHIQTLEDNMKQGNDVTTFQYHFDGRLLSTDSKHTTANTGYTNFSILTKNVYDKIGRIVSLQKRFDHNDFKTIANYDYDDVGRLKTKHLDPDYIPPGEIVATGLESLAYSYNIHNEITGINKDYALKTGSYDKWANFFGLYLGYDNRDGVFNASQLDGHVTGLLWNTQGDDAQRKYDYTYDNAGRLVQATFMERPSREGGWDNSKMDFSVSGNREGGNGLIEYDLNGNLLSMLQKGVLPGMETPVAIDDLKYTYASYSNKLTKVTDNTPQQETNGLSGDFTDGKYGNEGADDYTYDANGNMITDLNKGIKDLTENRDGITYNFLDKPEMIKIVGKGTVQLVYDADGNKLQKIFTPERPDRIVTTTYINQFVYQDFSSTSGESEGGLQYINFEEGRIRVITPVSQGNGYDALIIDGNIDLPSQNPPQGGRGAFDFFIRDYQENVRMILTEETHNGSNKCTMETARAGNEEPVFGQEGSGNEVAATRFVVNSIPGQTSGGGWQNANIGSQVSRLGNRVTNKVGPNVLLKVMAGDAITATTQYFYENAVVNTNQATTLTNDIITSLIGSIAGSGSVTDPVRHGAPDISNELNSDGLFADITEPDATNANGNFAKAYLTILFFDERFKYVEEGSTFLRVQDAGNSNANLTLANIKAPKNGYVYIYVSNESDETVYFDNLNVADNRGRIIEETHYYAFGLKIAAISSTKAPDPNEGNIDNKNLYNDKELFDDADLDWYDYGFRNYDAQIGRFTQLDPLTWDYPELTNYQYASDEPIANVDMDGLELFNSVFENGYKEATGSLFNGLGNSLANVSASTAAHVGINAAKLGVNIVRDNTNVHKALPVLNNTLNQATIKAYTPGYWDQMRDGNITNKIWYDFADNTHTFFGSLIYGRKSLSHLGGGRITEKDAGYALMGLGTLFIPGAELEEEVFYRYITEGEIEPIRNTQLLRGGNPDATYFTKELYDNGLEAQQKLSLKQTPTYRVKFKVTNNPNLELNGTEVKPHYGQPGGGTEWMTYNKVKVRVIKIKKMS